MKKKQISPCDRTTGSWAVVNAKFYPDIFYLFFCYTKPPQDPFSRIDEAVLRSCVFVMTMFWFS